MRAPTPFPRCTDSAFHRLSPPFTAALLLRCCLSSSFTAVSGWACASLRACRRKSIPGPARLLTTWGAAIDGRTALVSEDVANASGGNTQYKSPNTDVLGWVAEAVVSAFRSHGAMLLPPPACRSVLVQHVAAFFRESVARPLLAPDFSVADCGPQKRSSETLLCVFSERQRRDCLSLWERSEVALKPLVCRPGGRWRAWCKRTWTVWPPPPAWPQQLWRPPALKCPWDLPRDACRCRAGGLLPLLRRLGALPDPLR